LRCESYNASGWTPLRDHLARSAAQVVMGQETHLASEDEIRAATAWCRANAWQLVWQAATPTPCGGTCGGVAIFVRDGCLALGRPVFGTAARCVVALAVRQDGATIALGSVYLVTGQAMEEANLTVLESLAGCLGEVGPHFVVGGDFQCDPRTVEEAGVCGPLGATLIPPLVTWARAEGGRASPRSTCG